MVASGPLMLGSQVMSGALDASKAGLRFKAKKRANRQQRAALNRQIQDEIRLHMYRETERSDKLAKGVATQLASLAGAGILGGSTADMLRKSVELSAIVDRARDAGSTAAAIGSLVTGIEQTIASDRANVAQLPFSLGESILGTTTQVGQGLTDIEGAGQVGVSTAGRNRAQPTPTKET